MSELALKLIKEAKEKRLTHLDLDKCGLTELPDELSELTWLKSLSIVGNREVESIEIVKYLIHLTGIYISETKISDLSPLKHLCNLFFLSLGDTPVSDISPIKDLIHLQRLNLNKTHVIDLSPIENLSDLRFLRLDFTQVSDLNPLKGLRRLNYLDISHTKVDDLRAIINIHSLRSLILFSTQVSDLSPLKGMFLDEVFTIGSPIQNPPQDIAEGFLSRTIDYWNDPEHKKTVTNDEIKLIFVGNSQAGKTSLLNYIRHATYKEENDSTHGINIQTWDYIELEKGTRQYFKLNIWDFGGQEYFHSTHRLFLAKNAVYVLVWERETNKQSHYTQQLKLDNNTNSELEEVELEHFPVSYWLDIIRYYGGDSPVLIVQNKVDEEYQKNNYTEGTQSISDCFHLSIKNAYEYKNGNQTLKRFDFKLQDFKERLFQILKLNATQFEVIGYYEEIRGILHKLSITKASNREYQPKKYIELTQLNDIALCFDDNPNIQNLVTYPTFPTTILKISI